jgi:hypothetical protein
MRYDKNIKAFVQKYAYLFIQQKPERNIYISFKFANAMEKENGAANRKYGKSQKKAEAELRLV